MGYKVKKQTAEERNFIKSKLIIVYKYDKFMMNIVNMLDDTTMFKNLETGEVFTCMEIQMRGVLIDNGTLRKYVSYADFNEYEIGN